MTHQEKNIKIRKLSELLNEAVDEIKERHGDRAIAPGLECSCKFCTEEIDVLLAKE